MSTRQLSKSALDNWWLRTAKGYLPRKLRITCRAKTELIIRNKNIGPTNLVQNYWARIRMVR